MIIDKILDRKGGEPYNTKQFYMDVVQYGSVGNKIAEAMDNGTETDVKKALCDYIDESGYALGIKDYINSTPWLVMDEDLEVTDLDQEAIAEQVRAGNTSGILDSEDENGNMVRISWSILINKFIH